MKTITKNVLYLACYDMAGERTGTQLQPRLDLWSRSSSFTAFGVKRMGLRSSLQYATGATASDKERLTRIQPISMKPGR
jgi:hypothetical protein